MKSLFSPAIALMNRLGYTKKFMLLWLMALAAVVVMIYSLFIHFNEEITTLRRELEGIALIKPVSQSVQAIQRHRGLSAMLLAGDETIQGRRASREKEAAKAFDVMEEKLPPKLKATESWRNIKAAWERLQKDGLSMMAADNFSLHTSLIEQLLFFEVEVADEYALTLDPQIDTYYLLDTAISKLPEVLDHIGQLRAYGAGILTRKQITETQKINIYKIIGMLDDALDAAEINLEKTGRYNPAIQKPLSATSGIIADAAHRVAGIMESDILSGRLATTPEDFISISTSAIEDGYAQLYQLLSPVTDTLLKERLARAESVMLESIGVALLLILVVAYFAAGVYRSIIGNIRLLSRSIRDFANGNLHERVNLDTRDELRQVGDSFNEMADEFRTMLAARKHAEKNLQQSLAEQKEINRQLEEAQNQLLQSEKMASIGQLAAGVAHEINNPIGYVYSNLGTLERYVQDTFGMIDLYERAEGAISDPEVHAKLTAARVKLDIAFLKEDLRALMDESKDGITRVKKIVQNLKDFSHVDASDEWHFTDLHNGLDSTLNIVHNEIKYKANVVKEYGDLPEVECLSSQLNQVFMNLLVNAAHAIEERGTITIRTGRQGDEVWVEVADTGKGIAPEHIKKIFDPFFTTKPIGKGTGLGLSLSYGIVQKHHGRIEVRSGRCKGVAPGVWLPMCDTCILKAYECKGTVFRVWLPVKHTDSPPSDLNGGSASLPSAQGFSV